MAALTVLINAYTPTTDDLYSMYGLYIPICR